LTGEEEDLLVFPFWFLLASHWTALAFFVCFR